MAIDVFTKDGETFIKLDTTDIHIDWDFTRVFVTGVGHTGTNLLLVVVLASGQFELIGYGMEDRMFCSSIPVLVTHNYLAKLALDSPYFKTIGWMNNMNKFPGLKTLVTCRHPVDAILSGAYRDLPVVAGGDADELKDNDIPKFDLEHAIELTGLFNNTYLPLIAGVVNAFGPTQRAKLYRMEDLLSNTELVAEEIAGWLNIEYSDDMARPWEYNQHAKQQERYENKKADQIDVYKRWDTAYDGFYADKKDFVFAVAERAKPFASVFGYDIDLESMER